MALSEQDKRDIEEIVRRSQPFSRDYTQSVPMYGNPDPPAGPGPWWVNNPITLLLSIPFLIAWMFVDVIFLEPFRRAPTELEKHRAQQATRAKQQSWAEFRRLALAHDINPTYDGWKEWERQREAQMQPLPRPTPDEPVIPAEADPRYADY